MRPLLFLKHLLLPLSLLLGGGALMPAQAQLSFGPEWINFNQSYYKIPVARNGLYRLDHAYLAAAGLANADPRNFQLFRRGREVAVMVQGQEDGRLDPGDYLEFYGEKNDGKTDGELYRKREFKTHDYFSLYTDTAAYFLTAHPSQPGKRVAVHPGAETGLSPETWHYSTRQLLVTSHYSRGMAYAESQHPFGDKGEGFFSDYFGNLAGGVSIRNPADFTVDSLLHRETTGPAPVMEIALVGSYHAPPDVTISVLAGGVERVLDRNVRFDPYGQVKLRYALLASDISAAGTMVVRVRVNTMVPAGGMADLVRLAYIRVRYPRKNTIVDGRDLYVSLADSNNTSPAYLLFEGATAGALAYDVTDPHQIIRSESLATGSRRGFVFPAPAGRQRRMLLTAASKYFVPPPAQKRTFRQFDPRQAGYVIISNKQLARSVPDYANPVRAYADYRASAAGGGHDTLVFYVDQLYDQFHYGDRSALAIRRLMLYLLAKGNPRFLFLVGKGIEPDYGNGNFRRHPAAYPIFDLVPTGGAPGSDAVFTADFQQNRFTPQVATGRIAAMHAAEVASYLDKVKLHESLPRNADWRKKILHLGGGTDAAQQQLFRNYLKSYESVAEGLQLGAQVETISRQTAAGAVEFINLSQQVNEGRSLITFFGHSSPNGSDIDFGYASNPVNSYNNLGRYPMILLNGCFSGNAFSAVAASERSFGEDWVLTPRKGAIAFLAHTAFGYSGPLHAFSGNLYQTAFTEADFYGKPLGVIIRETIRKTTATGNDQLVSTALEMVLQADPALVLVGPELPDYAIQDNISLRAFHPSEALTAASDSFLVMIPIRNLGKVSPDSFHISVTRNGVLVKSQVKFPPVWHQDTLSFSFLVTGGRVAGENSLVVAIDPDNAIAELEEGNNTVQFTYNFPASGARPLFPVEYALVHTREVKLVGQATNMLQADQTYYFEIDTTHTFNSPARKSGEVQAGPFPAWTVTLLPDGAPQDSLVYYWRFRPRDQLSPADTIWGESSFRYIPDSPGGWSQSAYGQFTKAQGDRISLNPATRSWEFAPSSKKLQLRAAGGQLPAAYPPYGILVDGAILFGAECQLNRPNLLVTVISDRTLEPHKMPASFRPASCGLTGAFYHFSDLRHPANREYLRTFLAAVPSGFYVAMVSVSQVPFSDFTREQKEAIRALGSRMIDSVQTGYPFALLGRQGYPIGSATEQTYQRSDPLPPVLQSVEIETNILARGISGTILSTLIGPASEWRTLYHQVKPFRAGSDRYRLQVIGYDLAMQHPAVLLDQVRDRQQDLSAIDARRYPYLQLSLQLSDSLDRTAPQLQEWRVTHRALPEGVVRADLVGVEHYASLSKQAAKGKIDVRFAFQNISGIDFRDSLLARIAVPGTGISKEWKVAALKQQEVAYIPYTFATHELKGHYTLRLSVNPLLQNAIVQPEQYYFNNTLEVPFTYDTNLQPILDVAFNGRHIMDGDIVSPSPEISITLKDEDQYTFIQDPEHLAVFLQRPGSTDFMPVDLNGDQVQFSPAAKDRDFRLVYSPENLPDGIYTLRVQGKDVGNNQSGFDPYTIRFEVINESSITHFYPYPNPFSTKTRFVFTLTGSTLPDNMKIQILTITGKVVREIMQEELGPIRIGHNISAFAWDGSDAFGDKLANGVYLYRVVMTGTDDFKRRYTPGDKAFKKDYGKIYILR